MAKTAFATDNALTKKAWEEQLYRDQKKAAYFNKFMGTSSDSMIQEKTRLTKEKGDAITFGIRMRLTGSGVTSGQQLEGNEEQLVTKSFQVALEEYAHGVRDKGPLDRQRAMFSIDEESEMALKDWGGEKIDALMFEALATPSKCFWHVSGVVAGGTKAAGKAAITVAANSLLTLKLISYIKTWATTGGARTYIPLRPIKVNGRKYFVLLVHPDVLFDLRQDTVFQQAMREAEVRGPENPLFQGATAIWDGVVVHEHENVSIGTDGGAGAIAWATCHFLGAQAGVFAWGKRPSVRAEEFDYGREHGYGLNFLCKAGKPVFDSKDYGSLGVVVSRTNVSGT